MAGMVKTNWVISSWQILGATVPIGRPMVGPTGLAVVICASLKSGVYGSVGGVASYAL